MFKKLNALFIAAFLTLVLINPAMASRKLSGYAEDSAHASGDTGILNAGVRNDDLAALAGTDGDYAPLQVDANGALYVNQFSDGAPASTYTASVTATGSTDAGVNSIYAIVAGNLDGTNAHYLKIYDKATAATQSDTPILKIYLAANDTKTLSIPGGVPITTGISLRATTEGADSGTTGATANDVWVTLLLAD